MNTEEIIGRLDQLIKLYKCSSPSAFATKIGMNPSLFTRKMKGVTPITKNDFVRVYDALGVNIEWLRDGVGDMRSPQKVEELALNDSARNFKKYLKEKREQKEGRKIPYYDIDFTCSVVEVYNDESNAPTQFMTIPGAEKADFCCRTSGDSMKPHLMSGDIVAMKKVEDWTMFLPLNEVYGIVTKNGLRAIKVLKRGSDEDHFTLHSYNEEYEDQEIHKGAILAVFKVVASARIF